MFKRHLLVTVSTLALTGAASAADLPARMPVKAMPAPTIVQLWAGPYIGINGGAVWHRSKSDTTYNPTVFAYDSATVKAVGATVGGQIGYNWQSQNVVYGLEADINWVGAKDTHRQNGNNGIGFLIDYTTKLTWLSTIRARAGLASGGTLVYGTGGLAIGGVKNSWAFVPPVCCDSVTSNTTRVGWTAGGGVEHFISPRVTVKAEALYVDLGKSSATSPGGNYTSHFKNTSVVGRLGVNLKW